MTSLATPLPPARGYFRQELRLALRGRAVAAVLALAAALTLLSLANGLALVARQERAIAEARDGQADYLSAEAAKYGAAGSAGTAGYATWHLTWDPPGPLAFVAPGQRELRPTVLRVRLLGLQAQLYESEPVNPELALAGRFDFAFVATTLLPLLLLALLHDLVSREREAGRLRLLASLPGTGPGLWARRAAVPLGLLLAAVLLPFLAVALWAGAPLGGVLGIAAAVALYLAFWAGLALAVAALGRGSAANASLLLGLYVLLLLVLPAAANALVTRAVPAGQGVALALAQRQAVHEGWDLPKEETFRRFLREHPEWADTPPVTGRFHWKWYFAMQHAGDMAVAGEVAAYRSALLRRQALADRAGWLLPPVGVQALLHRAVGTDVDAQLAYQERVQAHHTALRRFWYPYLFEERPFTAADFARVPAYRPAPPPTRPAAGLWLAQALAALAALLAAAAALRRVDPSGGR